jgi:hypothetical protein
MLSHSAPICKQRDTDKFNTRKASPFCHYAEGAAVLPLYCYKNLRAGA